MDAIFANDPFRSDKEKEKLHNSKLSPDRHFVCCYKSTDVSRDINKVPGFQKSTIGIPGLVLMEVYTREN